MERGRRLGRLIEVYTPPGMEELFALGGAAALADGLAEAGTAEYQWADQR